MKFQTDQEIFWAGDFGDDYISRNIGDGYFTSNFHFFKRAFQKISDIESVIEFGANVGMNLRAIIKVQAQIKAYGVEINKKAANALTQVIGAENVFNGSIFEFPIDKQHNLSLIKGVLIHINPEMLPKVYEKLYQASNRYILICEYYNPSPVTVNYRGHKDRLYKRDFAGEMMDIYPNLSLIDYGFIYKRDPKYPLDDITWFLMQKKS